MTIDKHPPCDIGMIGLGTMGLNLVLNMADHGFIAAGYDKDPAKAAALSVYGTHDVQVFIGLLKKPRAIMLLVPAGAAVNAVIADLLPLLEAGDLIIDAGNSYFKDTDIRAQNLAPHQIHFLGMGISGGEEGARHGPSIMPSGPKEAYEHIRPILEAIAAKVKNDPCVTYLGPGSAGHFVKMVHNGIEYGIMQLIAETYDLMKSALGLNNKDLHDVYNVWNQSELNSYLIEITADIFNKIDEKTHESLIDKILAIAAQNGTGMWTSRSAMELQVPTPIIDVAVMMRDLSVLTKEREQASKIYQHAMIPFKGDQKNFIMQLQHALYAAIVMTYAQGMALLTVALKQYHYQFDLAHVAKIWRGGCIIRAQVLEEFCTAFQEKNDLANLLLAPQLSSILTERQSSLRYIVSQACESGVPMPGFMAALGYFDAYRSRWSPANLIQAQRDYFGSHTYQRVDESGIFHTQWEAK